jgi:copper chaperone CopZ
MEEAVVETFRLDLPTMYGDHHVTEVRRLMLELPGVEDVYASSGFQLVEVQYDEKKLEPGTIKAKLEEAGYLGDLAVAVEKGAIEERENGDKPFFRHTTAHEQTGQAVSFAQKVPYGGRPLWPCPGMGPLVQETLAQEKGEKEEELSYG